MCEKRQLNQSVQSYRLLRVFAFCLKDSTSSASREIPGQTAHAQSGQGYPCSHMQSCIYLVVGLSLSCTASYVACFISCWMKLSSLPAMFVTGQPPMNHWRSFSCHTKPLGSWDRNSTVWNKRNRTVWNKLTIAINYTEWWVVVSRQ